MLIIGLLLLIITAVKSIDRVIVVPDRRTHILLSFLFSLLQKMKQTAIESPIAYYRLISLIYLRNLSCLIILVVFILEDALSV